MYGGRPLFLPMASLISPLVGLSLYLLSKQLSSLSIVSNALCVLEPILAISLESEAFIDDQGESHLSQLMLKADNYNENLTKIILFKID